MQSSKAFLKSFIPVKIYQSASSLYMTCISKLPRSSFQPACDHSLVIEQALVSAVDEKLCPLEYAKRQREAREILLKSQENRYLQMGLSHNSADQDGFLTDEDDDEDGKQPVRLKSEILLTEYRKLYEEPSKTALVDTLPLKEIKQYMSLALSLCLVAGTVFILVECGKHNYFL
ncbi:uncharacterized protein LOC128255708 [Drosophila gunungcola]|uniref:Uncharacterized protein n=1 Tax=Drosophila gunungcola TaxID=103775 RepID=A0A9P9YHV8_9MUSC|nr:uncharacterized protein LOC128255708 [Drosophila gunungcola]KAI8037248.1 hypothetical protein M5D96_009999 [Drosophila gunungcola]